MAETTPLLPRPKRPLHEHSIFPRVCDSPWYFMGQRGLLFLRAFFALYMIAALAFGIVQESRPEHRARARFLPFDASTISFIIQTIYYWITAIWIFDHLTSPHSRLPPREQAKGRVLANTERFFHPQEYRHQLQKAACFSLFHTAAIAFPVVATTAYWLFLFPLDFQPDPLFWPRFLQYFKITNFTIVNSAFALLEVMVLSIVQKQKPLRFLVRGTVIIYIVYVLGVILGRYITGQNVYG